MPFFENENDIMNQAELNEIYKIEFPFCMLLFDKSDKQSPKLETVVRWSKFNLNMMNIYEEKYHQFLDMYSLLEQVTKRASEG